MLADPLTRDNLHLSQLINDTGMESDAIAIDCTERPFAIDCTDSLADRVSDLVTKSVAKNTRRAYQSDIAHFLAWSGSFPAAPSTVAAYLAAHLDVLSVATLVRRVASLSKVHEAQGLPNPCRSVMVGATLKGIKRTRGVAQQQARPLLREDLFLVLDQLKGSVRDCRDRALLLLGFTGGFRRSELVGLDHADIEHTRQGLVITVRFSKTDQEGAGRKIGIPYGRTHYCPVSALEAWLSASTTEAGPLFRPVDRHGHVQPERLSGEALSMVVRGRVSSAGLDPAGYSGHSLRAGFVTSAAQIGVCTSKIRAQFGHASDAMFARYVRDGELFRNNALHSLL